MVSDINIEALLGKIVHSVIHFKSNGYYNATNYNTERYKYDKADYSKMDFLALDRSHFLHNKTVDEQWSIFVTKFHQAVEKYTPNVKVKRDTIRKDNTLCPLGTKASSKIKRK